MKIEKLTAEEANILDNPADIPFLEIIKGMCVEEMRGFDVYVPIHQDHYIRKQEDWINTERFLVGQRENCEIDDIRLIEDFNLCHNGERFKVFYVLKFPHMVERRD